MTEVCSSDLRTSRRTRGSNRWCRGYTVDSTSIEWRHSRGHDGNRTRGVRSISSRTWPTHALASVLITQPDMLGVDDCPHADSTAYGHPFSQRACELTTVDGKSSALRAVLVRPRGRGNLSAWPPRQPCVPVPLFRLRYGPP